MRLGIADGTTEELIRRLKQWQWPDGGWNCDKRPEAHTSSFMETLAPLRAVALHAEITGSSSSRIVARRAAEVFLQRRLFRRRSDGSVINPRFLLLSFPHFWPYDILFGLQVMAEAGFIGDPAMRGGARRPRGEAPAGRGLAAGAESLESRSALRVARHVLRLGPDREAHGRTRG